MPFPTTNILDDFNRANAGPPPSANWTTTPFGASVNGHVVLSNQLAPDGAGTFSGDFAASYWSASEFGPDAEVYITTSSVADRVVLSGRFVNMAPSSIDGYEGVFDILDDTVYVQRVDNGTGTQLGATVSQTLVNGNKVGFELIGANLSAYVDTGSGWTSVVSRSDSTYTAQGFIALYSDNRNDRFDDFGGGTVISSNNTRRALLGVGK